MNKIQKAVAKLFKIKTEVISRTYNDPEQCSDFIKGAQKSEGFIDALADRMQGDVDKGCEIDVGVSDECLAIRHVPLGSGERSAKIKTTFVITITEPPFD